MPRLVTQRNNDGKHYGKINCYICREEFEWLEDKNAIIEVENKALDGNDLFLELKVIAKCPYCKYRYSYLYRAEGNQYKHL